MALVIAISSALAAEAQDLHDSSYALSQAESYLLDIRTADYTFAFSTYEHPIRVRSSGIMIRCDARVPSANAGGETVLADASSAFNGTLYQNKRQLAKVMECSRMPLDSQLMSGPCWTPLEYAYRWCRTKDTTFSWQGLHNPMTWEAIRKLAVPECPSMTLDVGGETVECVVVTITYSPQASSKVYLAVTKGFLPVKYEVYNASADTRSPVYTMNIEKLARVDAADSTVWFPVAISASQESIEQTLKPGFDTAYRLSYTVDPSSVHLNENIDDKVFTLDYSGMHNVFLDGNRVYLPELDKTVELDVARSEEIGPQEMPEGRSWVGLLITLNIVALLATVIFLKLRRS